MFPGEGRVTSSAELDRWNTSMLKWESEGTDVKIQKLKLGMVACVQMPAAGRLRHKGLELETDLDSVARPCLRREGG